jgi:hypothetical protein
MVGLLLQVDPFKLANSKAKRKCNISILKGGAKGIIATKN